MRKLIVSMGFYAILSLMLSCNRCAELGEDKRVLICIDETDSLNMAHFQQVILEDLEQIIKTEFTLAPNKRMSIQVVPINQLGDNGNSVPLEFTSECVVNEFQNQPEYDTFIMKLKARVQHVLSAKKMNLDHTIIFEPLCLELDKLLLNRLPDSQIQVLLYSDMLEHSDLVNMYRPISDYDGLLNEFREKYKNIDLPKDLSGVSISIVNFRDAQSNVYIRDANQFWNHVFEDRGATVNLGRPSFAINSK